MGTVRYSLPIPNTSSLKLNKSGNFDEETKRPNTKSSSCYFHREGWNLAKAVTSYGFIER